MFSTFSVAGVNRAFDCVFVKIVFSGSVVVAAGLSTVGTSKLAPGLAINRTREENNENRPQASPQPLASKWGF